MAIFQDEEMVSVTTPDGRVHTLPKSIVPASLMPQQIAPSGVPDSGTGIPVPGAPVMRPDEAATPALPAPDTGPIVEEGDPDITPVTVMEPEVIAANPKRVAKARATQAARAASPAGQQAADQARQEQAAGAVAETMYEQGDLQAAEDAVVADSYKTRNVKLNELELTRQQDMQAELDAQDKKRGQIESMRSKIEKTKINREADHPVMAAIFAGLAGLGSAMKGEKVDTLDILYRAIDRKVAAQEADLDRMAKVYGMSRDELAELKERSKSKLEFHNTLIAGETAKAIRHLEEITARSASEKTKANVKRMVAELQQRVVEKQTEAMRWGLDYAQKEKAERNQNNRFYADLGFRQRQHADNIQIDRERIAADLQKALAADKARGDESMFKFRMEMDKEARQLGVRDMKGDLFLTPAGQQKMLQAEQLEKEAAALEQNPDPMARSIASGKIELLRQKAAIMRGDARSLDVVKAHNDTEAVTTSNMISSGQSVVQLVDGIKQLSDQAGRGLISRDDMQVKLRAMFEQLKPGLKEAWQLGAWDKGSAGLVEKVIGADPTSEWNAGILGMAMQQKMYENPKAFQQGLDSIVEDLERKAQNKLIGLGVKFGKGETVLRRSEAPAFSEDATKLSQARSSVELTKDAEARLDRGGPATSMYVLAESIRAGREMTTGEAKAAAADRATAGSQSTKYVGLSKDQESPFGNLIKRHKGGDAGATRELVDIATSYAEKRPDLARPVLSNLREHAPEAYRLARQAIRPDSELGQSLEQADKLEIGAASENPVVLINGVRNSIGRDGKIGDIVGFKRLTTLATDPKTDPATKQMATEAVFDIITRSQHNQALPAGSVFKETP